MDQIIRLYPEYRELGGARGLYLEKRLHRQGFVVYADFATSMDGRIAIRQGEHHVLPENLSSPADLRLLLELQAQADCVVTHAGYLRARAAGRLGDILRIGALKEHRDLVDWRDAQSLAPQPLVVVCSTSLKVPLPGDLERERVWIATGAAADKRRVAELRGSGYHVVIAGHERRVDGDALMDELRSAGMNGIFLLAGPALFESLLARQCVDHLFITISHQFIGGADFLTLIPGLSHDLYCSLEQKELLFARAEPGAPGDWFAHFECRYRHPAGPRHEPATNP